MLSEAKHLEILQFVRNNISMLLAFARSLLFVPLLPTTRLIRLSAKVPILNRNIYFDCFLELSIEELYIEKNKTHSLKTSNH